MAYVTAGNRRQGRVLIVNTGRFIRSRTARNGLLLPVLFVIDYQTLQALELKLFVNLQNVLSIETSGDSRVNVFESTIMACHGTKIKKHIKALSDKLEECIEPQYGLLTKLVSSNVLTMRELVKIQTKGSDSYEQCVELLNCMQCKTPNDFEQFFVALIEKEQKHVANYISQNACRFESDHNEFYCWPLEPFHTLRIIINLDHLVELIECEHSGLLATLYSRRCINNHQMESVMKASTNLNKNTELLTMLQRRSIRDYNVFVEFLKESEDMSYLACLFEENVVVETVDCSIASTSAEPVRQVENKIVTMFRTFEQLRNLIRRFIRRDCHPNTELAAMKVGHSIRCFFFCGTPNALQSLYISINNGCLITTLQWIFQQLFGCEESIFVVKITGRLNLDKQKERVAEFCAADIGYVTSNHLSDDLSAAALSGFKKPFMLPYEVLEPILLQVVVKLFKRNQLRLWQPHPDVTSMLTISCVCRDWFHIITSRRKIQRKLKLAFRKSTVLPTELFKAAVLLRHRVSDQPLTSSLADVTVLETLASVSRRWMVEVGESGDLKRVKRLFHYNPQLSIALNEPPTDFDGPRRVQGVVTLENCVYVVYYKYNKVEVFDCENCHKKAKDIEVERLRQPFDMVGSSVTSQLFIFDWSDVIRVDLTTGVSDVFVRRAYVGSSLLSLVENRLLVTSRDSLLMYDIHSGERIKNIPLTGDWEKHIVYHAIESNRGSFFVGHGQSFGYNYTVSEIDSEGRVILAFNNDEHLKCRYLALDSVGRLLVADLNNYNLVLFDEHLKFKRILIDSKRLDNSRPMRLNYNKNNNRLVVGLENGQVKIFECNKCYFG